MVIDDSVESALRKQHCDVRAHAARCAGYQDHAVQDFAQNWTVAREFRTSCHGSVANHAGFRKDGPSTGQESTCKKTRNRPMCCAPSCDTAACSSPSSCGLPLMPW